MRTKLLVIVGIISLSLMGCSSGTPTETASPAAPGTPVATTTAAP